MTTRVHHLNCGWLHVPPNPRAACHCLLLEDAAGLALVDTGIGLLDVADPVGRLGQPLIDAAGFQFDAANTAARQLAERGFAPDDVRHIVLTHADPDHVGGLADFPDATVHVSAEEHGSATTGTPPTPFPRYVAAHFAHGPNWKAYASDATRDWYGVRARPLALGLASEVLLVPLFGHTAGHCGVAIEQDGGWLLHAGDAYYLRGELADDEHPVTALARQNAVDDAGRVASIKTVRRLLREHAGAIRVLGYHDPDELPKRGA